jgi:hypothetical protein
MPANYRIEMWSFPVIGSPLRHNFLVQVDGNGNVLKEIHGGAKGPGDTLAITAVTGTLYAREGIVGGASDYASNPLAAVGPNTAINETNRYSQREQVLYEGSQSDVGARWEAGKAAAGAINGLNQTYAPFPTGLAGEANSNSIANTVAQAATDVTYQNDPNVLSAPGSAINLLNQNDLNAARSSYGVPPRTGSEDLIRHSTVTDPITGQPLEVFMRTNGTTGETETLGVYRSTINGSGVNSTRGTIDGRTLDSLDTYENNPNTVSNLLLSRTTYDPLNLSPEAFHRTNYDSLGRVVSYTSAGDDGTAIRTDYDVAGRPDLALAYDAAGILRVRTAYDDMSRVDEVKVFDAAGRLDSLSTYTDASQLSTVYSYDDAGRVDSYLHYSAAGKLDTGYTYDDANRVDTVTFYDLSGRPDVVYIYDDAERIDSVNLFDDNPRLARSTPTMISDTSRAKDFTTTADVPTRSFSTTRRAGSIRSMSMMMPASWTGRPPTMTQGA